MTLTGDTFTGNSAANGGGLYNIGVATLTGNTFTGNSATDFGGGLDNEVLGGYSLTSINDTFTDNTATDGGGLASDTYVTLTGDKFSGNTATVGGGVYTGVYGGAKAVLTNNTFTDNTATTAGGLENEDGILDSSNDRLHRQHRDRRRRPRKRGFRDADRRHLQRQQRGRRWRDRQRRAPCSSINGNAKFNNATYGGDLENNAGGTATLTGDTFTDNGGSHGGGLDNFGGGTTATLTNDTFTGNFGDNGGGLDNEGFATVTLMGDTLTGNLGDNGGMASRATTVSGAHRRTVDSPGSVMLVKTVPLPTTSRPSAAAGSASSTPALRR